MTPGDPCARPAHVATTVSYWAVPGGHLDPIRLQPWATDEPGWYTCPSHWTLARDLSHMSWAGPLEVPIGAVTVKPEQEVYGPCPGTVVAVGGGRRQRGGQVVWLGCDRCGWVGRPEVEVVQEALL